MRVNCFVSRCRMTSESPEFSQFRRSRPRLRHRSRSAVNVVSGGSSCQAASRSEDHVVGGTDNVAEFDSWQKRRRRSSNSVLLSFRLSSWVQRQLTPFSTRKNPEVLTTPGTTTATGVDDQPPDPAAAVSASSSDLLQLTPDHDCKCASCPELADTTPCTGRHAASAPARPNDRPPRHHAGVRKTCSDTGFKTSTSSATTSDVTTSTATDNPSLLSVPTAVQRTDIPLLSVPAVFVTSYTRSLERRQPQQQQQQQQPGLGQSTSTTSRQRLLSMSDSRLQETSEHFVTPPSSPARIWRLTQFLCIGNAAAAADDRLLCRQSVFGLIDLCVAGSERAPGTNDRWGQNLVQVQGQNQCPSTNDRCERRVNTYSENSVTQSRPRLRSK